MEFKHWTSYAKFQNLHTPNLPFKALKNANKFSRTFKDFQGRVGQPDFTHAETHKAVIERSFLRISNNVSETSQNTLFSSCISCRPLATHYPVPQIQLLDFGAL